MHISTISVSTSQTSFSAFRCHSLLYFVVCFYPADHQGAAQVLAENLHPERGKEQHLVNACPLLLPFPPPFLCHALI